MSDTEVTGTPNELPAPPPLSEAGERFARAQRDVQDIVDRLGYADPAVVVRTLWRRFQGMPTETPDPVLLELHRLDDMAEGWRTRLPETVSTAAVVNAVHSVTRPDGGPAMKRTLVWGRVAGRIAEEYHRRRTRFESGAVPEAARDNVAGELLGLRGALGIAHGYQVAGGDADEAGEWYYQRWLSQQDSGRGLEALRKVDVRLRAEEALASPVTDDNPIPRDPDAPPAGPGAVCKCPTPACSCHQKGSRDA